MRKRCVDNYTGISTPATVRSITVVSAERQTHIAEDESVAGARVRPATTAEQGIPPYLAGRDRQAFLV